jgi:hypothetical protein
MVDTAVMTLIDAKHPGKHALVCQLLAEGRVNEAQQQAGRFMFEMYGLSAYEAMNLMAPAIEAERRSCERWRDILGGLYARRREQREFVDAFKAALS